MAKIEYSKQYLVGETPVPGVTTILKNLGWNKDILMAWAASVTKKGQDFRAISKEASETGTLAHALAEAYLSGEEIDEVVYQSYSDEQREKAGNALDALKEWQEESRLEVVKTEVQLVSKVYKYGGTADIMFRHSGAQELEIGDIKTSNGTYADYILQLAAYAQAAEECYAPIQVKRVHILRFGKGKTGAFHHSSWSRETWQQVFVTFKKLIDIHYAREWIEELL